MQISARVVSVISVVLVAALAAASLRATPAREIAAGEDGGSSPAVRVCLAKATECLRRARVTQNHEDYKKAGEFLTMARAAAPDDATVQTMLGIVHAGRHEFESALAIARDGIVKNPSIVMNYAIATDALVELGRYDEAVAAAQQLVDLRPCTASLLRVAYLRNLHGDTEGARELLLESLEATRDPRDRAWIDVQLAREEAAAGASAQAILHYKKALEEFPDGRMAELELARALASTGEISEASKILNNILESESNDADAHALLGEILQITGRDAEARQHFAAAESIERAEIASGGNEWHHLVNLYIQQNGREREALEASSKELALKKDIYTYARHARALAANGKFTEALAAAREARRTGSSDPVVLACSGEALAASGDRAGARELLTKALRARAALSPFEVRRAETWLAKL